MYAVFDAKFMKREPSRYHSLPFSNEWHRMTIAFSHIEGLLCNPFAGTMKLASNVVDCGSTCISIERGTMCFNITFDCLCRIILSTVGSERSRKGCMAMEWREMVFSSHNLCTYVNVDSEMCEFEGSYLDDDRKQNVKGMNGKSYSL